MALVERLMGLEAPQIAVHAWFAANHQRVDAALTKQEIVTWFQLNAAAIAEYDALAALAPTGTTTAAIAAKAMYVEKIHAVFILAEHRMTGYATPAEVRAKLGL